MSDTLLFQITQKEADTNNVTSNESSYTITTTFDQAIKTRLTIASGNVWQSISLSLTTSKALRIKTDEEIVIKLNSGTDEITVASDFIFVGTITALTLKNNSGSTAEIYIDNWG